MITKIRETTSRAEIALYPEDQWHRWLPVCDEVVDCLWDTTKLLLRAGFLEPAEHRSIQAQLLRLDFLTYTGERKGHSWARKGHWDFPVQKRSSESGDMPRPVRLSLVD
jgi:hypothetical protein